MVNTAKRHLHRQESNLGIDHPVLPERLRSQLSDTSVHWCCETGVWSDNYISAALWSRPHATLPLIKLPHRSEALALAHIKNTLICNQIIRAEVGEVNAMRARKCILLFWLAGDMLTEDLAFKVTMLDLIPSIQCLVPASLWINVTLRHPHVTGGPTRPHGSGPGRPGRVWRQTSRWGPIRTIWRTRKASSSWSRPRMGAPRETMPNFRAEHSGMR